MTTVYRCDWCGRFYASQLPESSSCPNHVQEHNARLRAQIERFNSRLSPSARELVAQESNRLCPEGKVRNGILK